METRLGNAFLNSFFNFFFAAANIFATEWRSVGDPNENGTIFLVDVDSIASEGQFVRAWTLENRERTKAVIHNKKKVIYLSAIALRVFDCTNERLAVVQGTFYSKQKMKGEVLFSFKEKLTSDLFSVVNHSTMAGAMLEFVCDSQLNKKIQT